MEPPENIRHICKNCAKEPDSKYIEFRDEYFINGYVKLKFTCKDTQRKELCWVLVKGVENEKLFGILDNDPILNIGYLHGDIITFGKDEIYEVLERSTTANIWKSN